MTAVRAVGVLLACGCAVTGWSGHGKDRALAPDLHASGDLYSTDDIFGNLRLVLATGDAGFDQGSPGNEPCRDTSQEARFQHVLTRDYAVMETEVTRQMWHDLKTSQGTLPDDPTDPDHGFGWSNPVQNLTWFEAILFANLLSLNNGLDRCYYTDAAFTTPIDATNYQTGPHYCDMTASGYRLLTEGEWEYACRAGTTTPFWIHDDAYGFPACTSPYCVAGEFPVLEGAIVYCANDPGVSAQVGSKLASPWHLYDMHGNVAEWCWDYYGPYPGGTVTDYTGPATGSHRMIRSGYWNWAVRYTRSASRDNDPPDHRSPLNGFRLARTVTGGGVDPVFQDGFESGDTSLWSGSVP